MTFLATWPWCCWGFTLSLRGKDSGTTLRLSRFEWLESGADRMYRSGRGKKHEGRFGMGTRCGVTHVFISYSRSSTPSASRYGNPLSFSSQIAILNIQLTKEHSNRHNTIQTEYFVQWPAPTASEQSLPGLVERIPPGPSSGRDAIVIRLSPLLRALVLALIITSADKGTADLVVVGAPNDVLLALLLVVLIVPSYDLDA
jgi:hypothetical protein